MKESLEAPRTAAPPPQPAPFRPLPSATSGSPDGRWYPRGDEPAYAFPVPWRWWAAILVFAAAFALTVAGGLIVGAVARAVSATIGAVALGGQGDPAAIAALLEEDLIRPALIVLGTSAYVLAAFLYVQLRHPRDFLRLFGPVRPHLSDVSAGVLGGLGAFVVANVGLGNLITFVVERSGNELPPVQQELQDSLVNSPFNGLVVFSVVILAPLGEELLFRGLLFQGLRRSVPLWPAIGISGLVFALFHAEPLAIVVLFPVGMFFAWLFHRRGTIVAPVFAHATFNTITWLLLQLDLPT